MDREKHLIAIRCVLSYLNKSGNSPFVLKGGTGLSLCYSLNRFSEDIDLDAPSRAASSSRFKDAMRHISIQNGYSFRISKDTATTQRAFLNYGDDASPLKIEVSYRRKQIPSELVCIRNGFRVYTIDEMARLKAAAYSSRDKIRDLYDVSFICTHYFDELSDSARSSLRAALEYKDLEQFDYIVRTQKDDLIDVDALETMFLESFDKLGLLNPYDAQASSPEQESLEADIDRMQSDVGSMIDSDGPDHSSPDIEF